MELLIKQLKGDYALGSIPTRHFFANETYFHLLLLASNLANWFKRLCLPPEFQNATLQTLQHKILLMPASDLLEAAWNYALHRINALKP